MRQELQKIIGVNPDHASFFLNRLKYDADKFKRHSHKRDLSDVPFRSPYDVVRDMTAVCSEAAAAIGFSLDERYTPRLVSLLVTEESKHQGHMVLAFYNPTTLMWGALGHSTDDTQGNREPSFRTLPDLARSYITRDRSYARAMFKKISDLPQGWAERKMSMEEFDKMASVTY